MKQILSLQIEDELLNRLKSIAEEEDCSVSSLVRRMIKKYLKEKIDEV